MLAWLTLKEERKKERSQKRDDLPVLATCQSATSAIHSSEEYAHACSWQHSILLM